MAFDCAGKKITLLSVLVSGLVVAMNNENSPRPIIVGTTIYLVGRASNGLPKVLSCSNFSRPACSVQWNDDDQGTLRVKLLGKKTEIVMHNQADYMERDQSPQLRDFR